MLQDTLKEIQLIAEAQQICDELRNCIEEMTRSMQTLHFEIESKKKKVIDCKSDVNVLQEHLSFVNEEILNKTKKIDDMNLEVETLTHQKKSLQKQYDDLSLCIKSNDEIIDEMKLQISNELLKVTSLPEQQSQLKSRITQLDKDIHQERIRTKQLEKQIHSNQLSIQALNSAFISISEQLSKTLPKKHISSNAKKALERAKFVSSRIQNT